MKKEMLINVLQPEECRIAIVEDGVLEELYVERTSHESYTGNIYKGKIVNLEPAIQAAFVNFSVGRNGFLHVSDVEPQYFHRHGTLDDEPEARPRGREREPSGIGIAVRSPRHAATADAARRGGRDSPPSPAMLPPPYPSPPRIEDRPRDAIGIGTAAIGIGNRRAIGIGTEGGSANAPTTRSEVVAIARNRRGDSGRGSSSRQQPDLGPPPPPTEPPPEPARPRYAEDVLTGAPEPPEPAALPEAAELGWDTEIGWGRQPEPGTGTGAPPRAGTAA